jgi:UDP-N-acetyl-D-glucosamine/UDP-N-acetyl-D-galactosamine dehydrogenase
MYDLKVGIVGLGYVGAPLLAACAAAGYECVGVDLNEERNSQLNRGYDKNKELSELELKILEKVHFTSDISEASNCNFYIICVPTPIDENKVPDLLPLTKATHWVSTVVRKGDYIVYESTVYPGVTRGRCVPIIEEVTNLKINEGFYVGYSPERVNPGDRKRLITDIVKIVSGSNEAAAINIDLFYQSVIPAGTYLAESLEIAEAAKVIENIQRDVNIALVNELEMLMDQIEIPIHSVLKAANTKWNFLDFKPGMVGGHCIGVDPYYLTHLAAKYNFHPKIISSGRLVNDAMAKFYADKVLKKILKNGGSGEARVLILGLSFKENVSDLRNSKVFELIDILNDNGVKVSVFDPLIHVDELDNLYVDMFERDYHLKNYSIVVLAVPHEELLRDLRYLVQEWEQQQTEIIDLKNALVANE